MPLIAQIDIMSAEWLQAAATPLGVVALAMIVLFMVTRRDNKSNDADVEQQRTMTSMVVNLSEQIGETQKTIHEQNQQILRITQTRTKDREEYLELKAKYEKQSVEIQLLQSEVKTLEKQVAKLQLDNKAIKNERDRYRNERDKFAKTVDTQRVNIIKLKAQNDILRDSLTQLGTQFDVMLQDRQTSPTQPIPELADIGLLDDTDMPLIDDDGNLITPIVDTMIDDYTDNAPDTKADTGAHNTPDTNTNGDAA